MINKKSILFFRLITVFLFLLTSCTEDAIIVSEDVISLKEDTVYETVDLNELPNLFNTNTTRASSENASETTQFIVPDLSLAYQDDLANTEANVVVIPSRIAYSNVYSRILVLKVNDTIRNVGFHLIPDSRSVTNSFTGRYIITDLQGVFIEGYKVEDRVIVSRYTLNSSVTARVSTHNNGSYDRLSSRFTDPEDCWLYTYTCGEQELEEVFIESPIDGDGGGGYVDIPWVPTNGGNYNQEDGYYEPSGGGGNTSDNISYEPVEACGPGTSYHIALNACDENTDCGPGYTLNDQNECVEGIEPDPESFCFKTTNLWQEAATTGVEFWINLITISPNGINSEYKHLVNFPQPTLFGMPSNLQIGNVDISNEIAAQVTANTVNKVMRETADRFALQEVSTTTVEQYFRSELIRQFPLSIPGGRVQFNAMNFSGIPCVFRHL